MSHPLYEKVISLSVYRALRESPVIAVLLKLLGAQDREAVLDAWPELFCLLLEEGRSLPESIWDSVLFSENLFAKSCARGEYPAMRQQVKDAARRDLQTLEELARLTPQSLLSGLSCELPQMPEFDTAWPETLPADWPGQLDMLANYHLQNGYGVFCRHYAFRYKQGVLTHVSHMDPITFDQLTGYQYQRNLVCSNTELFLKGREANNCLLYGDRGTGKSSTIKALLNRYHSSGLRMIEIGKEEIINIPHITSLLAGNPLHFIIFIDDLSFTEDDQSYAPLKAVLEGSLNSRPRNILIYATTNRRHLVAETFQARSGDEIHYNDTVQEKLSLCDRFGLTVTYSLPDKARYLQIVDAIAMERGLDLEPEALHRGAEQFALERGGRSPRCAMQYVIAMEGQPDVL